jgi:uncharacterized protein YkwD
MRLSLSKPLVLKYLPGLLGGITALALAGCMSFGGGPSSPEALPTALSARMDAPGASLDATQSVVLLSQYRSSVGAGLLIPDEGLNRSAQLLAQQYAQTGTQPKQPGGTLAVRYSAGYPTFAETFSGWRNSAADAAVLADPRARKAGIAAVHNPTSNYGLYWVLILAE